MNSLAVFLQFLLLFASTHSTTPKKIEAESLSSHGGATLAHPLPTVFILGAQKGGTTSLFDIMIQHPNLCPGRTKEPHFFKSSNFDKNAKLKNEQIANLYYTMFSGVEVWHGQRQNVPNCLAGKGSFVDATPMMYDCDAIHRLHEFYPEELHPKLRFIAILREPIARDWAGYLYALTHRSERHPERGTIQSDINAFEMTQAHEVFFSRSDVICDGQVCKGVICHR